ncbi:MAG: TRAP transporter small permease [Gammaproteobacteria bacterium]|nr:TRAP transporter small permease [Gammaproteobacteria bacterium]MBU1440818.1 TRAP transporter small permease [Gammaproteobacteria bacterium]MBU2407030.1 TRAP transporter small permease [Gammaproteobacteria bacterium]
MGAAARDKELLGTAPDAAAPRRHSPLIRFEETVAAIGLFVMLVQVCTEIVLRNFFNTSFLWSEEVSRYLMIWSVYFGAAAAVGTNGHLRIDMLIDNVPAPVRRVLDTLAQLWVLAFSIALTCAGYMVVRDSFAMGMVSADSNLPIQLGWIQLVIPLTFGLSAIHAAWRTWLLLTGRSGGDAREPAGH